MMNQRCYDSMEDPSYIDPRKLELMLPDIKESDVETTIAANLSLAYGKKVGYLEKVDEIPSKECVGIVFGKNARLFVQLLVRLKTSDKYTSIIFLVDTGSPYVFLSQRAMEAILPPTSTVRDMLSAEIHGVVLPHVCLSPPESHFSGINVLGTSFLLQARASLTADFRNLTLKICLN
eukprot:TRINITY_DN6478_c0_g1_i1.p1 TRINITY_DN6478_c0_g1~~TRINITY_DN6478_c0_g1_i1.p1  ORF type:complete len:177 (+),score=21.51 TRINITY_DN6478_c0_g1_i1:270-800(+)